LPPRVGFAALTLAGSRLLASCSSGIIILDIANPAQPIEVGRYDQLLTRYNTVPFGEYLLSGTGGDGLQVFMLGEVAARAFVGNGYSLTNLNAASIVQGMLADTLLSSNVALLNRPATFLTSVSASAFYGDGAGLSNLTASQIAGTIAESRIESAIARDSEVFSIVLNTDGPGSGLNADLLDGLHGSSFSSIGHVHGASEITTGILADSRLGANVALLNGTQTFTSPNSFSGVMTATNANNQFRGALTGTVTGDLAGNAATATTAGNFTGPLLGDVTGTQSATAVASVGGQSAATVASGASLANAATSANTANAIVRRDAAGNFSAGTITAASFSGSGASLSSVNADLLDGQHGAYYQNAANLNAGTLPDARLSGNVALLNNAQTFTGAKNFSDNLRVSDRQIYLRGGSDTLHGLGWFASSTFAGANPDGPVLYGCAGGTLGTMCGTPSWALTWDSSGNVAVRGTISQGSDRNAKTDFAAADPAEVLQKVAALPVQSWRYKSEAEGVRHLGPMAQDFHAAFGVGPDDKHIDTVDADGVALAAIQGLNQKVESGKQKTESRMERLEAENKELRGRLNKLERLLNAKNGGEQ
jgi:hypothetical protein